MIFSLRKLKLCLGDIRSVQVEEEKEKKEEKEEEKEKGMSRSVNSIIVASAFDAAGATFTGVDHSSLETLGADDHAQYLNIIGRAGGQTVVAGTSSGESLVLRSTSHATKGQVHLDETTASVSATTGALRVDGGVGIGGDVYLSKGINGAETKGSILVGDGTTMLEVPISADGKVLTADASKAAGLAWAMPGGFLENTVQTT
ncbi:unnamed protein product, partial [marine sediment metagenome]